MTPKERLKLLRDNFVQWSQFGLEHFDELEVALTSYEELKRDVKIQQNKYSQLIEEITNGLSKTNYTLDILLKQYKANNVNLNEIEIIFDDIINCELDGENLINYLKEVYNGLYKKLKNVDCEYLLTFEELKHKLSKVGKEE